jgi:DnaK suppressor protein
MSTMATLTLAESRRKVLTDLADGPDASRAQLARAALARLDDGSYGFCTRCGLKVPEGRLYQAPERSLCTSCNGD